MKQGSARWFRTARGGAMIYAAAVPGMLLLMAMEPTPVLLGNTAWILAILGLFMFFGVFSRLHYLKSAALKGAKGSSTQVSYHSEMRTAFAMFGWFNLAMFSLCGLVWVFPAKSQCFIQAWILGRVAAEGCG